MNHQQKSPNANLKIISRRGTSKIASATKKWRTLFSRSVEAPFPLDIQLDIPSEGITAIFGPSGAGKTSLLRMIAGLDAHPAATLSFSGERWQGEATFVKPHHRRIGYVFQEAGLFPHLTVSDNLAFARKRAFKERGDTNRANANQANTIESDINEADIIETLEIAPLMQQFPDSLSGGEKQRVAIARALFYRPQLLLLDEPLAALDQRLKDRILTCIKVIQTKTKVPMVYVSHSRAEVIRLAERVVLMQGGHVIKMDTPEVIFSEEQDVEGVEAILSGDIVSYDQSWRLLTFKSGKVTLLLPASQSAENLSLGKGDSAAKQVRVRILPKDVSITLSEDESTSILNKIPVIIGAIDSRPDSASVLVTLDASGSQLFASLTRYSVERLGLQCGMNVWAQIKSLALLR